MALTLGLLACAGKNAPEAVRREAWITVLTPEQISRIQETFPNYQPPKASPTVSLDDPAKLTAYTFEPARFFQNPTPRGQRLVPGFGLRVENNGYDCPANLKKRDGTYFGLLGNSTNFELRPRTIDPRNSLRNRMGAPPLQINPSPVILGDYGQPCADLPEIGDVIARTKEALSGEFPEIRLVAESDLQVTIEPTIFWVARSNFGDTWAGGSINKEGPQFHIRVVLFYISHSDFRIADWREFLVWELTNYYLLKIGRPEFVF